MAIRCIASIGTGYFATDGVHVPMVLNFEDSRTFQCETIFAVANKPTVANGNSALMNRAIACAQEGFGVTLTSAEIVLSAGMTA